MAPEINIVKIPPEPYKAMHAMGTAAELVKSAEEHLKNEKYFLAYSDAVGAMRLASAAIMFMDGYVAQTLEEASGYIKKEHAEIPAEEWREVEYKAPTRKGLLEALMEAVGLRKHNEKSETTRAVAIAKVFVSSAERVVAVGKKPLFERHLRFE